MDQGIEAEEYATKLKVFSGYVEITNRDAEESQKEAFTLIEKKVPTIYQPTFVADSFLVRCDFLVRNLETRAWDLYEVKGSNSLKDGEEERDHISDVTCQAIVLERAGVPLGKVFIVHMNNEYVRGDALDIEQLFTVEDCTEQVSEKKEEIAQQMAEAKDYLLQEHEPQGGCNCHLKSRGNHCATFKRSHPEIPDYSIHDLRYIRPAKLAKLLVSGIMHLHEIEDTSDFTTAQQHQIHTHKTGEEVIDLAEIANILDGYTYPLYFFDYETYAPAVPVFSGYKPWQRIPIQFSLHVFDTKGGPLRHVEFLHEQNSDPAESVAQKLEEFIDPKGTVLAWNVKFERGVTKELAERLPKHAVSMMRICSQMQDLMDVFSQQHYVHKDFRGKASIEAVMKVLLPEMSYDHLPYTGSDVGVVWWKDIVNLGEVPSERAQKTHLIKEYCKQDTMVMVEIFRILEKMVK